MLAQGKLDSGHGSKRSAEPEGGQYLYGGEVRLGEAEKLASKAGRMKILKKPHGDG
jgi:hypothetical protein